MTPRVRYGYMLALTGAILASSEWADANVLKKALTLVCLFALLGIVNRRDQKDHAARKSWVSGRD